MFYEENADDTFYAAAAHRPSFDGSSGADCLSDTEEQDRERSWPEDNDAMRRQRPSAPPLLEHHEASTLPAPSPRMHRPNEGGRGPAATEAPRQRQPDMEPHRRVAARRAPMGAPSGLRVVSASARGASLVGHEGGAALVMADCGSVPRRRAQAGGRDPPPITLVTTASVVGGEAGTTSRSPVPVHGPPQQRSPSARPPLHSHSHATATSRASSSGTVSSVARPPAEEHPQINSVRVSLPTVVGAPLGLPPFAAVVTSDLRPTARGSAQQQQQSMAAVNDHGDDASEENDDEDDALEFTVEVRSGEGSFLSETARSLPAAEPLPTSARHAPPLNTRSMHAATDGAHTATANRRLLPSQPPGPVSMEDRSRHPLFQERPSRAFDTVQRPPPGSADSPNPTSTRGAARNPIPSSAEGRLPLSQPGATNSRDVGLELGVNRRECEEEEFIGADRLTLNSAGAAHRSTSRSNAGIRPAAASYRSFDAPDYALHADIEARALNGMLDEAEQRPPGRSSSRSAVPFSSTPTSAIASHEIRSVPRVAAIHHDLENAEHMLSPAALLSASRATSLGTGPRQEESLARHRTGRHIATTLTSMGTVSVSGSSHRAPSVGCPEATADILACFSELKKLSPPRAEESREGPSTAQPPAINDDRYPPHRRSEGEVGSGGGIGGGPSRHPSVTFAEGARGGRVGSGSTAASNRDGSGGGGVESLTQGNRTQAKHHAHAVGGATQQHSLPPSGRAPSSSLPASTRTSGSGIDHFPVQHRRRSATDDLLRFAVDVIRSHSTGAQPLTHSLPPSPLQQQAHQQPQTQTHTQQAYYPPNTAISNNNGSYQRRPLSAAPSHSPYQEEDVEAGEGEEDQHHHPSVASSGSSPAQHSPDRSASGASSDRRSDSDSSHGGPTITEPLRNIRFFMNLEEMVETAVAASAPAPTSIAGRSASRGGGETVAHSHASGPVHPFCQRRCLRVAAVLTTHCGTHRCGLQAGDVLTAAEVRLSRGRYVVDERFPLQSLQDFGEMVHFLNCLPLEACAVGAADGGGGAGPSHPPLPARARGGSSSIRAAVSESAFMVPIVFHVRREVPPPPPPSTSRSGSASRRRTADQHGFGALHREQHIVAVETDTIDSDPDGLAAAQHGAPVSVVADRWFRHFTVRHAAGADEVRLIAGSVVSPPPAPVAARGRAYRDPSTTSMTVRQWTDAVTMPLRRSSQSPNATARHHHHRSPPAAGGGAGPQHRNPSAPYPTLSGAPKSSSAYRGGSMCVRATTAPAGRPFDPFAGVDEELCEAEPLSPRPLRLGAGTVHHRYHDGPPPSGSPQDPQQRQQQPQWPVSNQQHPHRSSSASTAASHHQVLHQQQQQQPYDARTLAMAVCRMNGATIDVATAVDPNNRSTPYTQSNTAGRNPHYEGTDRREAPPPGAQNRIRRESTGPAPHRGYTATGSDGGNRAPPNSSKSPRRHTSPAATARGQQQQQKQQKPPRSSKRRLGVGADPVNCSFDINASSASSDFEGASGDEDTIRSSPQHRVVSPRPQPTPNHRRSSTPTRTKGRSSRRRDDNVLEAAYSSGTEGSSSEEHGPTPQRHHPQPQRTAATASRRHSGGGVSAAGSSSAGGRPQLQQPVRFRTSGGVAVARDPTDGWEMSRDVHAAAPKPSPAPKRAPSTHNARRSSPVTASQGVPTCDRLVSKIVQAFAHERPAAADVDATPPGIGHADTTARGRAAFGSSTPRPCNTLPPQPTAAATNSASGSDEKVAAVRLFGAAKSPLNRRYVSSPPPAVRQAPPPSSAVHLAAAAPTHSHSVTDISAISTESGRSDNAPPPHAVQSDSQRTNSRRHHMLDADAAFDAPSEAERVTNDGADGQRRAAVRSSGSPHDGGDAAQSPHQHHADNATRFLEEMPRDSDGASLDMSSPPSEGRSRKPGLWRNI